MGRLVEANVTFYLIEIMEVLCRKFLISPFIRKVAREGIAIRTEIRASTAKERNKG